MRSQPESLSTGVIPTMGINDVTEGTLLFKTNQLGRYTPAPILKTDVQIAVTGIIARATVRQEFYESQREEGRLARRPLCVPRSQRPPPSITCACTWVTESSRDTSRNEPKRKKSMRRPSRKGNGRAWLNRNARISLPLLWRTSAPANESSWKSSIRKPFATTRGNSSSAFPWSSASDTSPAHRSL